MLRARSFQRAGGLGKAAFSHLTVLAYRRLAYAKQRVQRLPGLRSDARRRQSDGRFIATIFDFADGKHLAKNLVEAEAVLDRFDRQFDALRYRDRVGERFRGAPGAPARMRKAAIMRGLAERPNGLIDYFDRFTLYRSPGLAHSHPGAGL